MIDPKLQKFLGHLKDKAVYAWLKKTKSDAAISAVIPSQVLDWVVRQLYAQLQDASWHQTEQEFLDALREKIPIFSAASVTALQKVVMEGKNLLFEKLMVAQEFSPVMKLRFFRQIDEVFTEICMKTVSYFLSSPADLQLTDKKSEFDSYHYLLSRLNLFYNAFQHSTDGIIITDLKGRILEVNEAFLKIFGYEYDEVIGRTTAFLRAPDTQDEFYAEMWRSISETGEWKGEIYNRCKNGEIIPVWLSITPIYEENQRIGYMGVEIDISEQKKIENALIKEKMFTESLIETANSLIVGLNLHGEITIFNKKLEEVTGYSKEEVLGKSWFEIFVPASQRPSVEEVFDSIVKGAFPSYYENPILTKSGEERFIAWSNTTIRNEKNEIIGALGIGQDVTEQRRLEHQILQSERLATIGQMAAKVAHEIRNPLSSISLNAELLGDEIRAANERPSGDAELLLKSIMSEVDRVATLTEEYLQFSRLPDADPQPGNLIQVVQEVVDFIEPEASSKGIQIIADYKTRVSRLVFDSQQIRRVLLNIARNAIEAMKNGGILRFQVNEHDDFVEIAISDTGEGIREEDKDKIFEPFYTTKDMGTGLGLAISQQVIQEHGGKIYFETQVDQGTTFFIQLPRKKNEVLKN